MLKIGWTTSARPLSTETPSAPSLERTRTKCSRPLRRIWTVSMIIGSLKASREKTGLAAAFSRAGSLGCVSLARAGEGSIESAPVPAAMLFTNVRRVVFMAFSRMESRFELEGSSRFYLRSAAICNHTSTRGVSQLYGLFRISIFPSPSQSATATRL